MERNGIIKSQQVTQQKIMVSRDLRKTMTPAETEFWDMVRNRRMHGLKFRRQQVIDGFVIDFYCDFLGLRVEIDGEILDSKRQIEYDDERDKVLRLRGLRIIRFSNEVVLNNKKYIRDTLEAIL